MRSSCARSPALWFTQEGPLEHGAGRPGSQSPGKSCSRSQLGLPCGRCMPTDSGQRNPHHSVPLAQTQGLGEVQSKATSLPLSRPPHLRSGSSSSSTGTLGVAQQGEGSMVGCTESLAGLPGLSVSREVVAVLLGPHPALGAGPAPGPCSRGQGHDGDCRHCQEQGHDYQGPAQGLQVHGQPFQSSAPGSFPTPPSSPTTPSWFLVHNCL